MKNPLKGQQAEIVIPFLISNGGTCGSLEVAGYALGQTRITEEIAISESAAKAIGRRFLSSYSVCSSRVVRIKFF